MEKQPRTITGRYDHKQHKDPELTLATTAGWPEPAWETLEWHSRHDAFRTSNFMSGMSGQTYEAFIPAVIAETGYRVSNSTAALADEAAREVALFDEQYGKHLQPFSSLLLRSESVASSQIENLTANARSLGEAELGVEDKANAAIVVRNVRAMETALEASDRLDSEAILRMHAALMAGTGHSGPAGEFRQEQVWIGTSVSSPVGATFVPPNHQRVPNLIEDLVHYAARTDVPPMVQAAIAHAQFETIHPFTDGNGRTGRALLHAMLRHQRVTTNVTVPVSAGLLTNVHSYHEALTAYREGDPEAIVNLTSEASLIAISNGTRLVQDIERVTAGWREKITARSDSAVWPVLDLLARQPVVNAHSLELLGLDYNRTYRAMTALQEAGVVIGVNKYQKGRFWRAPEILTVLDDFAARAGNRMRS